MASRIYISMLLAGVVGLVVSAPSDLEESLWLSFQALPKNSFGRLPVSFAGEALRRHFAREHGLKLTEEAARGTAETSDGGRGLSILDLVKAAGELEATAQSGDEAKLREVFGSAAPVKVPKEARTCDVRLRELEAYVQAPATSPERLARLAADSVAQRQRRRAAAAAAARAQFAAIAVAQGNSEGAEAEGLVALHGERLAEVLYRVYPSDCPVPESMVSQEPPVAAAGLLTGAVDFFWELMGETETESEWGGNDFMRLGALAAICGAMLRTIMSAVDSVRGALNGNKGDDEKKAGKKEKKEQETSDRSDKNSGEEKKEQSEAEGEDEKEEEEDEKKEK